jgi:hypothetical protein
VKGPSLCHNYHQRRALPLKIPDVPKVLAMTTPHSNERLFALCALIAEEKDPGKFLLLVHELNNAFESSERNVEDARLNSARRRAKVSVISQRA